MARLKTHKDVEFTVSAGVRKGQEIYETFNTFDRAASRAVNFASARGHATIDILVYSRAGARWLYGDDGVDQYDEDPEASVFERIEIKANVVGRIA